ncbi:M48 family metallopeptidase [Poseidonibacter lekithochrous]|uniref:M48 family metallopeptidase n=1 Tax=Poseidonibacter lekithochrous TaxID=1904463 RepID=UPI0008FC9BA5|nr:M48 family metallopeptidase [Poseidonibacter lekithochrous]QKJ23308.1 metallopeptidase, M48 family [Poseidonibacter lekithochrous]
MIEGILYKQNSTTNQKVVLILEETNFLIKTNEEVIFEGLISELIISNRLGNTKRVITLKNGDSFSTFENDFIDEYLLKKRNLLYKFEKNILLVLVSIVITALFTFSIFKWGIPIVSEKIAHIIPHEANELISNESIEFLDEHIFTKTKLSKETQKIILTNFNKKILPLIQNEENIKYKIIFRNWKVKDKSIANAFALPNGNIILTDEFIKLSSNQNEIDSVILHEVGHVYFKHGMQRLTQSTFTALITMYITGDLSSFAQIGVGFGSLFISSNYSRNHELQADLYSFEKMIEAKIDPIHFANIMEKLSTEEIKDSNTIEYLSSHPQSQDRVFKAKYYSNCFNQKIECKEIKK